MAIKLVRKRRKNAEGTYDTVHYETQAPVVWFEDGQSLQKKFDDGALGGADIPVSDTPPTDAELWIDTATEATGVHYHDAGDITSGVLPVVRGGTGVTSLSALATALGVGGGAKVQTGSYQGTGKYGSSNPNSITCSFVPKLLFVGSQQKGFADLTLFPVFNLTSSYDTTSGAYGYRTLFTDNYGGPAKISGNTVSWYAENYLYMQLNSSSYTYYWVAIG